MTSMDDGKHFSGAMSLEERLQRIETKLDDLILGQPALALDLAKTTAEAAHVSSLHHAENDTKLARIKDKLDLHDRVLMATCGCIGLTIIAAILKLVVKGS